MQIISFAASTVIRKNDKSGDRKVDGYAKTTGTHRTGRGRRLDDPKTKVVDVLFGFAKSHSPQ